MTTFRRFSLGAGMYSVWNLISADFLSSRPGTIMAQDVEQAIEENAKGPKRAKGDSGEIEQHTLTEQLGVDRYRKSEQAAKSKGLGVRMTKLVPPGSA
jgi:hypothetical protein